MDVESGQIHEFKGQELQRLVGEIADENGFWPNWTQARNLWPQAGPNNLSLLWNKDLLEPGASYLKDTITKTLF